jgi:hypothetical protein
MAERNAWRPRGDRAMTTFIMGGIIAELRHLLAASDAERDELSAAPIRRS